MSRSVTDTGPFAIVPEWLLDSGVSARAVVLYARLSRHADGEGKATPSRRRLAEMLGCSVDSVDRAADELISVGAIERRHRRDEAGDPTSNEWLIRRVPPQEVAASVRPPGRNGAPSGGRTDAATGSRTGAARTRAILNETSDEETSSSSARGELIVLPGVEPPEPEPVVEVTDDGVRDLVGEYVDAVRALGAPAPRRLVGQVARQVGELAAEGVPAAVIRSALQLLVQRRLNPSTLPSLVPEAAAGPRQPPTGPRPAADAYSGGSREPDPEREPPPAAAVADLERISGRRFTQTADKAS